MSADPLPTSLYESLFLKLATVLELTQKSEGIVTPQAKQALLQATNDFKNTINQAKEFAGGLAGGEMLIEDQDEVIAMLEELRDRKRDQLAQFASQVLVSGGELTAQEAKMEVDSMASTPCND
ncbi:hypothetical protein H2248_000251 [Termitomyces sp. 'cryptogamus']|nr:hypothetical protein H2248_000251 [Termitomyces sp. 'cryptogamus']